MKKLKVLALTSVVEDDGIKTASFAISEEQPFRGEVVFAVNDWATKLDTIEVEKLMVDGSSDDYVDKIDDYVILLSDIKDDVMTLEESLSYDSLKVTE